MIELNAPLLASGFTAAPMQTFASVCKMKQDLSSSLIHKVICVLPQGVYTADSLAEG